MAIPTFYPTWETPVGALGSVTEGETVTYELSAIQEASFMGVNGTAVLYRDPSPPAAPTTWANTGTPVDTDGWFVSTARDIRLETVFTTAVFNLVQPQGNAQVGAQIVGVYGDAYADAANTGVWPVRLSENIPDGSEVLYIVDESNAVTVTTVFVNNVDVTANCTIYPDFVFFNNPVTPTDIIRLQTNKPLTYTLLHDNLPPGLILTSNGLIAGTVGAILSSGPQTYNFAVRISDGKFVRDRQFSLSATPAPVAITPPAWGQMPSFQFSASYGGETYDVKHVPIGQHSRGTTYFYQIPVEEFGGLPAILHLDPIVDVSNLVAPFNTLPQGLALEDGAIVGNIDTEAPLGLYFFRIIMRDHHDNAITSGTGAEPRIFMISVTPPEDVMAPIRFVRWNTVAGSLGSIYEAQACPFGVSARSTSGDPVTYTLLTSTLPPGLALNKDTGDIEGVVTHVGNDETFTFRVRAQVDDIYEDRTFSITVLARYQVSTIMNLSFKLRAQTTKPMIRYYGGTIEKEELFRPADPNFGMVGSDGTLSIYVIGGLNTTSQAMEQYIANSVYKEPIRVLLGKHKIAYAKINGKTVYEVLYREVLDPQQGAGGWKTVGGSLVEDKVVWPHSPAGSPVYIYPASLDNIRSDFIKNIGYPSIDPALANVPGSPAEAMPLWMGGKFTPSAVVAYLAPGTGQGVLDRISLREVPEPGEYQEQNPINDGYSVEFDQYYATFQAVLTPTTFINDKIDDGTGTGNTISVPEYKMTFDGGLTTFDTDVKQEGKYYRLKPQNSGGA